MSDLSLAMSINKPTIYASYGNKFELFSKALATYDRKHMNFLRLAFDGETSREVVEGILSGMVLVAFPDGFGSPGGYVSWDTMLATSDEALPVKREVRRRLRAFESELVRRLDRARTERTFRTRAIRRVSLRSF